jgi:hypothetical protein
MLSAALIVPLVVALTNATVGLSHLIGDEATLKLVRIAIRAGAIIACLVSLAVIGWRFRKQLCSRGPTRIWIIGWLVSAFHGLVPLAGLTITALTENFPFHITGISPSIFSRPNKKRLMLWTAAIHARLIIASSKTRTYNPMVRRQLLSFHRHFRTTIS